MKAEELQVKHREGTGRAAGREIRRRGSVPAILYGHNMKPVCLEVNARELYRVLHTKVGENVIVRLVPEGVSLKESTCVFKDIQNNPVTDQVDHVDFMVISLTEKIAVKVPLIVRNAEECAGVRDGGILDIVHHEIDAECLPADIPEHVEVDVKALKIGQAVHISELALPPKVTWQMAPDVVVVAIHAPKEEEAAAPAEGEAVEPEVIEKGKKPEAEEGEGAPAGPKPAGPKKEEGKKAEGKEKEAKS